MIKGSSRDGKYQATARIFSHALGLKRKKSTRESRRSSDDDADHKVVIVLFLGRSKYIPSN